MLTKKDYRDPLEVLGDTLQEGVYVVENSLQLVNMSLRREQQEMEASYPITLNKHIHKAALDLAKVKTKMRELGFKVNEDSTDIVWLTDSEVDEL